MRRISLGVQAQIAEIVAQREWLKAQLELTGCVQRVFPSDANFLLVRVDNPDALYDELVRHGIIVRNRNRVKGCEGCLRLTVGTPEENLRLLEVMRRR